MSAIDDGVVYIQVTSKPHRSPIGSLLVVERSAGTDVTPWPAVCPDSGRT